MRAPSADRADPPPNPNLLRDHLANERTFLSWIRTAIAVVALGFVVARFGIIIREVGGAHVHAMTAQAGAAVGVVLVIGGIAAVALATKKFDNTRHDIDHGIVRFSPALDVALAVIVAVVSVVLAVYLVVTV
ncbi:MAG: YidH family protein [Chloroflexota bacterium]